jgi:hypothetical protein
MQYSKVFRVSPTIAILLLYFRTFSSLVVNSELLHNPGHGGCQIPDYLSIQVRVQPLAVRSQIGFQLRGPLQSFFFCGCFSIVSVPY